MLIKGKKSKPTDPKSPRLSGESHAVGQVGSPQLDEDEQVRDLPWTVENYQAGLVSERRQQSNLERRRGYRRVEEKELISKAVEEANAIREKAREEGLAQGIASSGAVLFNLKDAIDKLLNAREEALEAAADEIGALAVEIAERIIRTEVMCDSSLVVTLVRDTVQKTGRQSKTVLIKVHPDDVTTVKQALKEEPIEQLRAELIVMEDNTVDQGSCIVETNSGLVDASFSTQLGILKQLFGSVPRHAASPEKNSDLKQPKSKQKSKEEDALE
ncbi:MAG: FliH/SctL family protein [Vampirovibrionales bacterium]|nr:FliH/SctL family protein [Vampirovibrionales bacterium]